jgi:hypothetical protein
MEINNMAQLSSPGVSVSVIDESFYTPAAAGTVPLFIVASAQDKKNGAATGIAPGTKKSKAGEVYLLTSQKDLSDTFGIPKFYTDASNNPIHAGEQNEYGLEAAYSFLGVSNRAYVVRADLDVGSLTGTTTAPFGAPADNTYWFDTTDTKFGVFQWDSRPGSATGGQTFTEQQTAKNFTIITDVTKCVGGAAGAAPLASVGQLGDYALVATSSLNKLYLKKYLTDTAAGTWVEVGTAAWSSSWPTATGTISAGTVTLASGTDTFVVNGTTITASGTTLASLITQINANSTLTTAGIKAANINGYLNLYSDGTNINNATYTGSITLSGTAVAKVGLASTIYMSPQLQLSAHTIVPLFKITDNATTNNGAPTGSLWIKTTSANFGADWIIKQYSSATGAWASLPTTVQANGQSALYALDPTGGGLNLGKGQVYVKYNDDEATPALAHFKIYTRNDIGATTITSNAVTASTFTSGVNTFAVRESLTGSASLSAPFVVYPSAITGSGTAITVTVPTMASAYIAGQTVILSGVAPSAYNGTYTVAASPAPTTTSITLTGTATGTVTAFGQIHSSPIISFTATGATGDAALFAADFNAKMPAGTNVVASVTSSNQIVITHATGGEIRFLDGANIPLSKIFTAWTGTTGTANFYGNPNTALTTQYIATLWSPVNSSGTAVAPGSATAPTSTPDDGTLWYNTYVSEVDIMINNGTKWCGYRSAAGRLVNAISGSITSATGPYVSASQPTGTFYNGDLWIDTSDLENYPLIHKYVASRPTGKKWVLLDNSDQTSENGVVFHDARWNTNADGTADAGTAAPSSIADLLASDFVDFDAPDPALYPKGMLLWNLRRSGFNVLQYKVGYVDTSGATTNPRLSNTPMTTYYANRWVSHAANQVNGAGSFGRKAVRSVVLAALNATIQGNQQIRDEESRVFNLIACPGYPEAINEMVGLNADRGYTAFVVGDTPARLEPNATSLSNWGNNVNKAVDDGDDGLITTNPYLGVFYPWGYTTDLLGNNIVVPPSHMMLRTIALSDNVSYPWFAPAGTRRGGITNASSVGYVSPETGEFVATALNTGQRDTLASIHVNPITYLTGIGLVNYGQYTRQLSASSLDRINVARLVVYLRRQFTQLAKPYIFEPNDTITRNQIKQAAEQLLLELVGQRALYDYLVVCDTSNNTPSRIDRSELYLDVAIEPVKAVEFIYIPLRLKNTGGIKATGGV